MVDCRHWPGPDEEGGAAREDGPGEPALQEIIGLAAPFFGLIALGYAAGKIWNRPQEGLEWLNLFLVYFALPALFFKLLAQTPFDELGRWSFILSTTFSTYTAFALSFAIGYLFTGGRIDRATIQGIAGSYANVGYMGPGLTFAALGPAATVPTALIFCFDSALLFTLAPLLMGMAAGEALKIGPLIVSVLKRVFLHPFIMATIAGVIAAYFEADFPEAIDTILTYLSSAAAPTALFAMGVTVALRPLQAVPWELPGLVFIKLIVHPIVVWLTLGLVGDFDPMWVYTAILMAALPPALNVFIIARQYDVYVEQASSTVLVGTVVSVITLTTALYLVTNGIVPPDPFPNAM